MPWIVPHAPASGGNKAGFEAQEKLKKVKTVFQQQFPVSHSGPKQIVRIA
jgi:hypothetical protein